MLIRRIDMRHVQEFLPRVRRKHQREITVKAWYENHAQRFEDLAAVDGMFVGLSPIEQQRLNRFKLWVIEHGGIITLADKHILEFGAGHGRLAIEFPQFASYTGVDFSRKLVELGQRRLARAGLADRAQLIIADCLEYDGPAEAFDVVCSLGLFSFVNDPERVLQKMVYHLKEGGALFIDFRYSSPLYDPIRHLKWRLKPPGGAVATAYKGAAVRRMLQAAGLTKIRIVVREYPLLGDWYARKGWDWLLAARNRLAANPIFDVFGTDAFAFGFKPHRIRQ